MNLLTDDVRQALTAGRLAHLVTINPDGSPQASLVWIGVDGDEIVLAHLGTGQKMRNLARDPRVVLTVEADGVNQMGLAHYLTVQGTARLVEGGAPELLQELARVYLGPDVKFPPMDNPPAGHVVRITPTKIGGVGPWSS